MILRATTIKSVSPPVWLSASARQAIRDFAARYGNTQAEELEAIAGNIAASCHAIYSIDPWMQAQPANTFEAMVARSPDKSKWLGALELVMLNPLTKQQAVQVMSLSECPLDEQYHVQRAIYDASKIQV